MRLYELLFITNPEYGDEEIQAVIARYQQVIEQGDGVLKSAEKWGKRRFAYEIDEQREGLYILVMLEAGPEVPREIDRLMKIDQDIIRHVIVRKEEKNRKRRPAKAAAPVRAAAPRVVQEDRTEETPPATEKPSE